MHLTYFSVQGFKNFVDKVEMTNLGPINVIHGENNVGKSNLLQAIWLFFRLAHVAASNQKLSQTGAESAEFTMDNKVCRDLGFDLPIAFHVVNSSDPIEFIGKVAFDKGDQHGLPLGPDEPVRICWRLIRRAPDEIRSVVKVFWPNTASQGGELRGEALQELLAAIGSPMLPIRRPAVTLVRDDRASISNTGDKNRPAAVGTPLPPALAEELYQSRDASDPEHAKMWRRFAAASKLVANLFNGHDVLVLKPKDHSTAVLAVDNGSDFRLLVKHLGSGVQQVLALLAHLLNAGSDVVLLEEPELNLRFNLQERLRVIFRDEVVGKPGGPKQLFLTSHSPAFEGTDDFYWVKQNTSGNPVIVRDHASRAREAVGLSPDTMEEGQEPEHTSWVSTEGLLRLPKRAQDNLGVWGGSVIVLATEKGLLEVMTYEKDAERHG